ncbi:MAG: FtsL-like putative cell division protein [Prolixibacteraceae bacterium]
MEETKNNSRFTLGELLNGKFFERQIFVRNKLLMFIIFLMLLANIAVRYRAAKVLREVDRLERDVKELRAHSITVASEIIKLTRPSEILDRVKNNNLGLEPSKVPPRKIYVEKD